MCPGNLSGRWIFVLGTGELIARLGEPMPLSFWLPTLWGGCVLIFAGGFLVKENTRLAKGLVLLGCAVGFLPSVWTLVIPAMLTDTGDPHRRFPARRPDAHPPVRDPRSLVGSHPRNTSSGPPVKHLVGCERGFPLDCDGAYRPQLIQVSQTVANFLTHLDRVCSTRRLHTTSCVDSVSP
jgi:hypothetical protein